MISMQVHNWSHNEHEQSKAGVIVLLEYVESLLEELCER